MGILKTTLLNMPLWFLAYFHAARTILFLFSRQNNLQKIKYCSV